MRCRKLRLASYSAASTLLHVFGGSAALACAEPLIAAACADLSAEATAPPVPPPARSEQPQPHKRHGLAVHAAKLAPRQRQPLEYGT